MTDEAKDSEIPKTGISMQLMGALTQFYKPAESFADSDDTKSTQELITEMSSIEEIFPYEVNRLMEENCFKLHYNGSEYVWLLKLKN